MSRLLGFMRPQGGGNSVSLISGLIGEIGATARAVLPAAIQLRQQDIQADVTIATNQAQAQIAQANGVSQSQSQSLLIFGGLGLLALLLIVGKRK